MSVLEIECDCGASALTLEGEPRVCAFCHCNSCQNLLNLPLNALAAWPGDAMTVSRGSLKSFKYPGKELHRFWCPDCGSMMYDTNRFGFAVISQTHLRKAHGGELPEKFLPDKHIFYSDRIVDIDDPLPKYLEGVDGPLFEKSQA